MERQKKEKRGVQNALRRCIKSRVGFHVRPRLPQDDKPSQRNVKRERRGTNMQRPIHPRPLGRWSYLGAKERASVIRRESTEARDRSAHVHLTAYESAHSTSDREGHVEGGVDVYAASSVRTKFPMC